VGLVLGAVRRADANEHAAALAAESRRVQDIVDAMRVAMAVSPDVSVQLVPFNPLKASVEPVRGRTGAFRLSIEQSFLDQLTAVELRAVVAHELGHVWIATHHPYLQTEQLANQIAMRVVSREILDSMYGKVWPDAAGQGSLPRFPETRSADLATQVDEPAPQQ
jgi:Zn-dependent protease with chaperone function